MKTCLVSLVSEQTIPNILTALRVISSGYQISLFQYKAKPV
jgi:hypothetical protein